MSPQLVVLCTIPHTATQFFAKVLGEHFPRVGFEDARRGEKGLVVAHVTDSALDHIEAVPEHVLITTVRDWPKVKQSYINRGEPLSRYRMHRRLWYRLLERDPVIVSVDDDRESRLMALSEVLGVDLQTDWVPVNEWKG